MKHRELSRKNLWQWDEWSRHVRNTVNFKPFGNFSKILFFKDAIDHGSRVKDPASIAIFAHAVKQLRQQG